MVMKMLEKITKHYKITVPLMLVFACVFPLVFNNPYSMRIATISLIFVMITLALNIVTGYMGQTSFGTAAFWGLGAYTGAILASRYGVGIEITFVLAAIISGIFGFLVGIPVLKLKGYYLAIVTLGFCEIVRLVELNWTSLTGGPLGIMNIPKLKLFGFKFTDSRSVYFLMLIMVILTTIVVYRLVNSAFGLVLTSIKDDEIATQAMGINVVEYKIKAFVIHAMICGVAGAFYAQYISYIDSTMFTTNQSIEMLVMAIVGGMGSIVGSFVGAIVLSVLPEIMRGLTEYRMLIYGFIMVIMMIVKPEGIFGNINFVHIKQRLDAKSTLDEVKSYKRKDI